ncbi:MAG: glycoside hydrolase family 12 [Alteromonadaceae bacterium]|nr:MAG: glycoside hydrolase family 12 [Alteromonadaceae bacterium]
MSHINRFTISNAAKALGGASFAVALSTAITSCTSTTTKHSEDHAQSSEPVEIACNNYQTVVTPIGNLVNNVWNEHSAVDYDWHQCMATREVDGETQYGWVWDWPENGTEIYAQPQITLGQNPWTGHPEPFDGYPIPVDTLEELSFDYDVEINTNGKLNLSATFWMTTSAVIQKEARKDTIAAEFMIWTYANEGFYPTPAGSKFGEITASGVEWEVWVHRQWHDTSGLNDNKWIYIAFRTKENALKIKYDAAELIAYSIEKGLISKDLYIADIHLGNEVMSGQGDAWLKKFDVVIREKE